MAAGSAVGTPRPPRPPGLLLLLCAWLLPLLGGAGARGEAEPSALPEDAAQEHGYYLQQLFGLYGANGTLPSAGLARLLGSLGLGRVQVVRIQHEEMGHGHVSHLDLLEVQEERHRHRHPAWEHGSGEAARDRPPRCPPGTPPQVLPPLGWGLRSPHGAPPALSIPPPQCLNVTQLLLNFGLDAASQLTPQQFTLLCPALLYQIDSRVCIHHRDEVTWSPTGGALWPGNPNPGSVLGSQPCPTPRSSIPASPHPCIPTSAFPVPRSPSSPRPHAALGWALLAVTFISVPSAAAVAVVPLLSLGQLHALLSFLVALAVGTLCGDALLHLWPHAQGQHQEPAAVLRAVLQGLAVLGGIYVLLLLELLLGMLRRRRATRWEPRAPGGHGGTAESRCAHRLCSPPSPVPTERPPRRPRGSRPRCEAVRPPQPPPAPPAPTPSRAVRPSPPAGAELRCLTAPEVEAEPKGPPGPHHGHSHGPALPPSPAAADLAWMVVLGDGIHNLTDGLAIGVAFSHSLPSGLSTALAVLCHELPHELGDLAVLLQAGTAPRTLLLLNLLSALLSCLGAAVGAAVGQNAAHLTPWILTATAGTFLYVALADMLPEVLRGPGGGTWGHFVLQNVGFLLGSGIMLGIALAEGHLSAWLQP
ncbi:LOW QUALITY PROTEIN: zinc transporter ZIP5 [Phasianus colchicus]|uniref:LOW QUALITY PROTEIN: zinc transporter ZIP5 n=1 Tax=Phasianus colchicus TaxID=9054 RepID=UPI00129E9503|nr:LOW QUALITY PROTEIN: zinc transporter ZIP5 [Phasianus colchicus]